MGLNNCDDPEWNVQVFAVHVKWMLEMILENRW